LEKCLEIDGKQFLRRKNYLKKEEFPLEKTSVLCYFYLW